MKSIYFIGDLKPDNKLKVTFSDSLVKKIGEADFVIANLEAPITDSKKLTKKTGQNFKLPLGTASLLNEYGIKAVTLANNHITDYGAKGVLDTVKICNSNGIQTVGAGSNLNEAKKPLRLELSGQTISIINTCENEFNKASLNSPGANTFDFRSIFNEIQNEKKLLNTVIVVFHGGVEYVQYPSPMIVNIFKYLIDIGVDCVVSHHTHFYSGAILYKDKPIIFGLGNFYKESKKRLPNQRLNKGLIAKIDIGENKKIKYSLIPTIQDNQLKTVDLLSGIQKETTLNDIDEISNTIDNKEELERFWISYIEKEKKNIINLIFSKSKIQYKLRKKVPFLNKPSDYQSKVLLNLIQCDSHRYKVTKVLESLYNKKKSNESE